MLSILIPTYNYNVNSLVTKLYNQCIEESIVFEIIVLDDASTEYFLPEITSENIIYLKNEKNLGRTLTRKKLAEAARYDSLLFLDSDVIPVSPDFIKNYILTITNDVVLGGVAYIDETPEANKELRHKYGRLREEVTAIERTKNPYGAILSGNLMIKKDIFLKYNYPQSHNLYGMDIYFSYQLYKNNVAIVHIDNPVYHLGLEDNDVFFKKSLQAVESRKQFLANADGIENINGLLKHYKKLKKYRLTGLVSLGFKITEPLLRKMILKKDPNLFCLDIYRLGYICTLK
ncbi:glycosyltransferase family 2 protein [Flavobacterium hauense]